MVLKNWEYQLFVFVARAAGLPFALINHRGYYRFLKWLKRMAPEGSFVTVNIAPTTKFPVDLKDQYWMRLLARYFYYEPEIAFILHRAKQIDYLFIDGGANFGYWSLMVTSPELGAKRCIAIEAFPSTHKRLVENAALNDRFVECIHAAVFSTDNESVHIGLSKDHSSASMNKPGGEPVNTTTIDRLTGDVSTPIIIKLDIEGAEIAALRGAERTLKDSLPLIIYEDHGKDPKHKVTQFILDTLNLPVFFVTRNRTIKRIDSLGQLDRVKKRSGVGYNFFSTHPDSVFYGLFGC